MYTVLLIDIDERTEFKGYVGAYVVESWSAGIEVVVWSYSLQNLAAERNDGAQCHEKQSYGA
jgi:hypothetical protein